MFCRVEKEKEGDIEKRPQLPEHRVGNEKKGGLSLGTHMLHPGPLGAFRRSGFYGPISGKQGFGGMGATGPYRGPVAEVFWGALFT